MSASCLGLLAVALNVTLTSAGVSCHASHHANIYSVINHATLAGHSFEAASGLKPIQCGFMCLRRNGCRSFNYGDATGLCQLNDGTKEQFPSDFRKDKEFSFYDKGDIDASTTCRVTTENSQTKTGQLSTIADHTLPLKTEADPAPTPSSNSPVLTCPNSGGSYTYNGMVEATVFWDSLPSAYDAEDGSLSYKVRCKDETGRSVYHRHTSLPIGTNTTVTCSVTDSDGNVGSCQFGFVVVDCPCCQPLGMESGEIGDEQITAGSVLNRDYNRYGPQLARLNSAGWCADMNQPKWIQVDYTKTVDIYGTLVQKHNISGSISKFDIMYSDDGESWNYLSNDDGTKRALFAWDINLAPSGASIAFQSPSLKAIRTRFLRLSAVQFSIPSCLRLELIGCKLDQ